MMSSHEVGQFGPVTPVLHADCQFDSASGGCAVDDQGTIHAFVAFAGKSCAQEPPINYVSGSGGSWTPATTPYRGWVLGMAVEGTRLFLLFSNSDGIHLGQLAQGQFTPSQTLSQHSPPAWGPGGEAGGGSVVAKNGKWWAVWSERADPSRPFHLYQASTMTSAGDLPRQRIRSALPHALHNAAPSMTLDPADPGGAAPAWFVTLSDAHGMQDGAVVRFARADGRCRLAREGLGAPAPPASPERGCARPVHLRRKPAWGLRGQRQDHLHAQPAHWNGGDPFPDERQRAASRAFRRQDLCRLDPQSAARGRGRAPCSQLG